MSFATYYWIAWGLFGFALPESIALLNKAQGDTLSEQFWNWIKGRQQLERYGNYPGAEYGHTPMTWNHNTWRTYIVGSFLIWLFFHLTFGWFS